MIMPSEFQIKSSAMTNGFHFTLMTICIFSLIFCQSNQNPVQKSESRLVRKLDSIGQSFIDEGETGAISIAVMQGDSLLYNNAFGFADHAQKIPVTKDHYFLLASVSKLVGSAMTMKLVEEGKLSLDQSLAELLPDFPNIVQAGKITLRHLLTHTSGLLDYAIKIDTVYIETGNAPSYQDYMNFFAENELLFEPGSRYAYSNSGFKLMEFIIERATGRKFAEEIDRIINNRAGLDIKLIAERNSDPLMTRYFDYSDTAFIPQDHWTWLSGDGGMTATSATLARFAQMWSDGTIISKRSFENQTTPFILQSGIATGYGIGTRTGPFEDKYAVGHTGGNQSAYAMMMYFPEDDISIAVFDNVDGSPTSALHLMGPVALAVFGKSNPNPENGSISESDENAYSGIYEAYGYVSREPNRIKIYFNAEDRHFYRKSFKSENQGQKIIFLGHDQFTYQPYPMDRIEFIRNTDREVIAYRAYYNGLFQRMGFKITTVDDY